MRKGTAKPEKNTKPSITLLSRTRTPLEAFQMLRQGQTVDIMAGYYDTQQLLSKDFWMMDKTAKLHHLAELKTLEHELKKDIEFQKSAINQANQILKNEQENKQNNQVAKQQNTEAKPVGPVPESGTDSQRP